MLDELHEHSISHHVLFLDADEETLLGRYKETRRRHPLSPTGSVAQGIAAERKALAPFKTRADLVLDTSGISAATLRRRVIDEFLPRQSRAQARADVHVSSATSTDCRAMPTRSSTCAFCPTRTGRPRCGR